MASCKPSRHAKKSSCLRRGFQHESGLGSAVLTRAPKREPFNCSESCGGAARWSKGGGGLELEARFDLRHLNQHVLRLRGEAVVTQEQLVARAEMHACGHKLSIDRQAVSSADDYKYRLTTSQLVTLEATHRTCGREVSIDPFACKELKVGLHETRQPHRHCAPCGRPCSVLGHL